MLSGFKHIPPTWLRWWPLGGILLTLGFAPFYLWPLGLIALALWVWGVRHAPDARAALTLSLGWGFAHGLTALYWLPWAFWHYNPHLWFALGVGIPATLGLGLWHALGYGLVGCIAWRWRAQPGSFATLMLIGVVGQEFLRTLTPYGFPWLPLGAMWAGGSAAAPLLAQLASVGSVTLLSALVMLLALLIAHGTRLSWLIAALVLSSVAGFGWWRVQQPLPLASGGLVRVVQPNIQDEDLKWDRQGRWEYLAGLLALSTPPQQPSATVIVLPETAIPFNLEANAQARAHLAQAVPSPTQLLTGAFRLVRPAPDLLHQFNSLHTVEAGQIMATYDKHLLVPFGEFIPGAAWLAGLPFGLAPLSQSGLNFTVGTRSPLLPTALGPVLATICYEGIFPLYLAQHSQGARWIANLTNDVWFTGTIALAQHASLQRLRAIELGLPLVRSANTGISLVVGPFGEIRLTITPNKTAVHTLPLPAALPSTPWRRLVQTLHR